MPEKSLKTIEKSLLYSKKPVVIRGGCDRRAHYNNNINIIKSLFNVGYIITHTEKFT